MPNLRILYNNVADASATLVASSTAGSLVASNLLTDLKSDVWRATSTSATLTLTWSSLQTVGLVALPFCNLTSTATMRVRLYTNTGDALPVLDTGAVLASPSQMPYGSDFGILPLGVNAYAYGGGAYAYIWMAQTGCRKAVVDIVDTANTSGYVEAARLVVGPYWSPTTNPDYDSIKLSIEDTSRHERSDAGNLHTDRGPIFKSLTFDLSFMPAADRDHVWRMLRGNGKTRPVFVSLTPENTDKMEEQIYQIYGKLTKLSDIQYKFMNQFANQVSLEEI